MSGSIKDMSSPSTEVASAPTEGNRLRPRPTPDPSILRPSITISVTGMKQAVQVMENGTAEVRNYLLHECNIIYECKTCFNMFRSLANFVSHKRSYCQVRHQEVRHVLDNEDDKGSNQRTVTTTAYVEPEAVETIVPEKEWDLKDYSPSLSLLKEAGFIDEITSKPLVTQLYKKKKPGIDSVVRKLKDKLDSGFEYDYYKSKLQGSSNEKYLKLENITQTNRAMFQTYSDNNQFKTTMGQRYVELQKLKQNPSVLMGPDGRIINPGKPPKSISPTYSFESTKENSVTRVRFRCPLCKKYYAKVSAVYRHIVNSHSRSMDQAKALRNKIRKQTVSEESEKGEGNGGIKCKPRKLLGAISTVVKKNDCKTKSMTATSTAATAAAAAAVTAATTTTKKSTASKRSGGQPTTHPQLKRGRPKNDIIVEVKKKRGRGRPRKET